MIERDKLMHAHARIQAGWTQGWYAKDRNFNKVHPSDPTAVCFCLAGSLLASGVDTLSETYDAVERALPGSFTSSIPEFNDDPWRTKDDILAVLDRAIQSAPLTTAEAPRRGILSWIKGLFR